MGMVKSDIPTAIKKFAATTGLALLLTCISTTALHAADFGLDTAIYKIYKRAEKLSKTRPQSALALLRNTALRSGLSPYSRAMIYQQMGYLYFSTRDYPAAINAYKEVLAQEDTATGIPRDLRFQAHLALGQLYSTTQDYAGTIKHLRFWLDNNQSATHNADQHNLMALLAYAYYVQEKFVSAATYYELALRHLPRTSKNLQQREDWLRMLSACYSESGSIKKRITALKKLVSVRPSRDYLLALAQSYSQSNQRKQQTATLEIAYKNNLLKTQNELLTLASLLLDQKAPIKAAMVIERSFNQKQLKRTKRHLTLLAQSYIEAREYSLAIDTLTEAVELSSDNTLYTTIGTLHFELKQWQQAASAFEKAMPETLTNAGTIYLLLGQSYLYLQKFDTARQYFNKALNYEKSASDAKQWINYSRIEQTRVAKQ